MTPEGRWRPVIAALANPVVRTAYARIVLGAGEDAALDDLSPSRQRSVRATLLASGLVEVRAGELVPADAGLRALLATGASVRVTGPERFLGRDGRIDRYPGKDADRRALLEFVAGAVLAPGETVSESELNERLERFTADVAALRRYLVDAALLNRTPSGSQYTRQDPHVESGA